MRRSKRTQHRTKRPQHRPKRTFEGQKGQNEANQDKRAEGESLGKYTIYQNKKIITFFVKY